MLLRKSCDKIHRDLLEREGALFSGNAVEWYFPFVSYDFILLAGCAAFYVVGDPLSHPCPWQDLRSFPDRFISSGVSCGGMTVDERHKVSFRRVRYLGACSVYEEVWFKEGLVFVVVFSVIRVGWTR